MPAVPQPAESGFGMTGIFRDGASGRWALTLHGSIFPHAFENADAAFAALNVALAEVEGGCDEAAAVQQQRAPQ